MTGQGLILSAPSSGSGKTTLTLGLLRALHRRGVAVRGAKSGPDYIDPRFHAAACAAPCPNLDAWAMSPERVRALAAGDGLLLIEGAMGLFDGAPPEGRGATADLALGAPLWALGYPMTGGAYNLTTIRQRANQMVAETVTALLDHIENPKDAAPRKVAIDGPLVVRTSARLPKGWTPKRTDP